MNRKPDLNPEAGPYEFTPSVTDKNPEEPRWHLEDYISWPVGPRVERSQRLEKKLPEWGRRLFNNVISDREALIAWMRFRAPDVTRPGAPTIDAANPLFSQRAR